MDARGHNIKQSGRRVWVFDQYSNRLGEVFGQFGRNFLLKIS